MNKLYSNLLVFILLSLHVLSYAQARSGSLTFEEAEDLSGEHFGELVRDYVSGIGDDWLSGVLKSGDYEMPFECYVNGDMPEDGYPLYISMHGGGGTTAEANNQQWENQKRLYGVVDGVYFVPRSPTDTWNMWHQEYMDDFLLQVATYAVARLGVDPARVYILGYSAGGDGVFNLAPRLSDRFAAAAMMAGHPGDAQIENLRNLPFAIYMGANDTAYNRAGLAGEWLKSYEALHADDAGGFEYNINIFEGKGHWMDRLDSAAIGWLAGYRRVYAPERVVWIQDDVLHTRKYNLEVAAPQQGYRVEQVVDCENNTIYLSSEDYKEVTIWLDDYIVDLDMPVRVLFNEQEVFNGMVARSESNIIDSIIGRYDPEYIYWAKVTVKR